MSPSTCSSAASFSFCIPANQSTTPNLSSSPQRSDSADPRPPVSDLLLCSGTVKASCASPSGPFAGPDCLSTLPTVLLQLTKTWLIDKESLLLILTSHRMHKTVRDGGKEFLDCVALDQG